MPDVGQIFKEERESADARGRKGRARQKMLRHHEQLLLQCRNNGWVVMHEADLTKGRCGGAADTPRLFGSDLQVRHRYYIVHVLHVLCSVLALTEPLAALDGMSRLLARLLHLVGSLFVGSLDL